MIIQKQVKKQTERNKQTKNRYYIDINGRFIAQCKICVFLACVLPVERFHWI